MIPANYFPTHRSPCHPRPSSRHLTIPAVTPAACRSPPDRIDRQISEPADPALCAYPVRTVADRSAEPGDGGQCGTEGAGRLVARGTAGQLTATDGLGPSSRLCLCARGSAPERGAARCTRSVSCYSVTPGPVCAHCEGDSSE